MEEYKNKVIEIEKESQRLIEALKGLEDNAKALRDAKGDIQSTSAKIVEFLDPLKTVTQKISNITSASHNIINNNIENQKRLESKLDDRIESQTKAINSTKEIVEENIKIQEEFELKINERLDAQVETVDIVKKKLISVEVLIWIILALIVIAIISSFVAPSAINQRVETSSSNIGLTSQQPDEYSGHIVCKGKIEGEKCNGGVLVKNDARGGFYGCENFNNGNGCKYTVDYPFICKGCKKYMVKRPKGRVTKNGKPVLIWGCPDYLETRAKKCEEYWDYK
jgi:hypothetical protein